LAVDSEVGWRLIGTVIELVIDLPLAEPCNIERIGVGGHPNLLALPSLVSFPEVGSPHALPHQNAIALRIRRLSLLAFSTVSQLRLIANLSDALRDSTQDRSCHP
jgi:hypothetical protein